MSHLFYQTLNCKLCTNRTPFPKLGWGNLYSDLLFVSYPVIRRENRTLAYKNEKTHMQGVYVEYYDVLKTIKLYFENFYFTSYIRCFVSPDEENMMNCHPYTLELMEGKKFIIAIGKTAKEIISEGDLFYYVLKPEDDRYLSYLPANYEQWDEKEMAVLVDKIKRHA